MRRTNWNRRETRIPAGGAVSVDRMAIASATQDVEAIFFILVVRFVP